MSVLAGWLWGALSWLRDLLGTLFQPPGTASLLTSLVSQLPCLFVASSCTALDSSNLMHFPRHLELMQHVRGMLREGWGLRGGAPSQKKESAPCTYFTPSGHLEDSTLKCFFLQTFHTQKLHKSPLHYGP